ncbi:MAG: 16S rRNA (cytosine(1402)-N(4))-methyltransferase RsmH [Planctomycetota bacterium]|jgi:16S rRNA (cytosine1402-N4)-methyltransferase
MSTAEPSPDQPAAELHVPVLPRQVVEALAPAPGRHYLDCTLGMGGHSELLLTAGAAVTGIDRDGAARSLAAGRLAAFGERFAIEAGTYADVAERLAAAGQRFDGVLADIGVSSLQLDDLARGFSIRSEADLDLRMGDGCREDALSLISRLDDEALAAVLWHYGEERQSRRVARALKAAVAEGVRSGVALADVIRGCIRGHHKRHPALRSFQALRIAVNDELGQFERLLAVIPDLLAAGGSVVVITFHSLEDRLAKRRLREHVHAGRLAKWSAKVVTADDDELATNRRAAPAKLRWARAA